MPRCPGHAATERDTPRLRYTGYNIAANTTSLALFVGMNGKRRETILLPSRRASVYSGALVLVRC